MDNWQPFPLPDGSYADDTRPFSNQDVVGLLPTRAELPGARSPIKYAACPGMELFASVGTGPIRGKRDVEGKLFVVSGNKLYQVAVNGVSTELGTIPGTARVSMTHNQVAGGNQLVIGTGANSYVWDTAAGTLTANGVALQSVDFLNQLILGIEPQRRFFRYSGLADATEWNDLDNEAAESSPDRIVGGIVSQGEYLVFGERTIEVWSNSPTDNTSFQRGTVIEKGCANANTICRLDNTVYFLGNDLIVYRLNGYTPVPVSTKAQAAAFRDCSPEKAFAFTYEDNGYVIYYLTFQDGMTWGFDVTNQRSHRRESFGLTRWRLNTLTKWNGEWYGGDYSNGNLYRLRWKYVYEGFDIFPRRLRTGVLHADGNRIRVPAFRLLADTGLPASTVELTDIDISGDLSDGYVGQTGTYAYTITGGKPTVACEVISGALPDGAALSSAGVITYDYTTAGSFSWTIRATGADGSTDTVSDSATISTLACGAANEFNGGNTYPSEYDVLLGSDTGTVTLRFCAGVVPDKAQVWFDGVKVIDTGYLGELTQQDELDAALAALGLPSETVIQRTGTTPGGALTDWDAGEWDEASFVKGTGTITATVKIYAPIGATAWKFALSCPGGFP